MNALRSKGGAIIKARFSGKPAEPPNEVSGGAFIWTQFTFSCKKLLAS
jgi:hypothetical protein